jgi:hypothetical protein
MASAAVGFMRTFGADEPMGCYDDIENADAFVLWGSNMAEMHPILWTRVTDRRLSAPKTKVAVLSTFEHRSYELADLTLTFTPQTDLAILNYIANHIIQTKRDDRGLGDDVAAQRFSARVAERRVAMHQRPARIGLAQRGVAEDQVRGPGRDGLGIGHDPLVPGIGRRGAVIEVAEDAPQQRHRRVGDAGAGQRLDQGVVQAGPRPQGQAEVAASPRAAAMDAHRVEGSRVYQRSGTGRCW